MSKPSPIYLEMSQWDRLVAFERELRNQGVCEGIHDRLEAFLALVKADTELPAKGLKLANLIAGCRLDHVDLNITAKNFPVAKMRHVKRGASLLHLERDMSHKDALEEIARQQRRPATLIEQLVWCVLNMDAQTDGPIAALGTEWVDPDSPASRFPDCTLVPVLDFYNSQRTLALYVTGPEDWTDDVRFLTVPA